MDGERAELLLDTLLKGVEKYSAEMVLMDVTGVPFVDTPVADMFLRAASAVKLLGAQLILTGIRPDVARTMIGLSADLLGVVTLRSLEQGIAFALSRMK